MEKPVEAVEQQQRVSIIMPPLPEREVRTITQEQDALAEGEE